MLGNKFPAPLTIKIPKKSNEVVKMQIKEICEITGKTREEIERMLDREDVIELKLTEKK